MLARTPLSTKAKPYEPLAAPAKPHTVAAETCSKACKGAKQTLTFVGYMAFQTTVFATNMVTTDSAQSAEDKSQITNSAQPMQRGRKMTRELPQKLPSRTPSPSARSVCLSEVSTEAERTPSQAGSLTCTSASDINEYLEGSLEFEDFVVKNTFIDGIGTDGDADVCSPKLSRCQSAPGALLSCPFKTYTMADLHEMGRCKPCAYLYGKADGCRRGSECTFCHACPPDELKNRKKNRLKAVKARRAAFRAEQALLAELGDDVISHN